MKSKLNSKIILITLSIVFLILSINTRSYANSATNTSSSSGNQTSSSSGETTASEIISSGKNFIDMGKNNSVIDQQDILDSLLPIANIVVYIATGVFLVTGAILGLKYMLAESAQDRANIKKSLIWFVIAMFIVYGGVGIYNIVVSILNGLF